MAWSRAHPTVALPSASSPAGDLVRGGAPLSLGGVGESGFGRIHGEDGLREFSRAKSITRQWMKPVVRTTTFNRTSTDVDRIVKLVTFLHGRRYQEKKRR